MISSPKFCRAVSVRNKFIILFVLILFIQMSLFSLGVQASGDLQWVQSSWVDVRSAPNKDAKSIANFVTNTSVHVEQRKDEWCMVSTEATGADATKPIKGFIACNTLGNKRLSLNDVNAVSKDGTMLPYREQQAFWIAPTVRRFTEVGSHLNYRALSAEQENRERSTRIPIRFEIPEFEAMKKRLIRGVVPLAEQELARVNVNTFKSFNDIPSWQVSNELINHMESFNPQKNLPAVKPSLFKRQADVLLSGEVSPDSVSIMLGQPNNIKFTGKPEWITGQQDEGVSAIWDIRRIDVQYAQPITLHSVSHKGFVAARMMQSTVVMASSASEGCTEGYPILPEGNTVPGYPRFKEYPLVSFFTPRLLPAKKIDVLTRKIQAVVHTDPYSGPKNPQPRSVLVHTLDLDQDGVPDLAIIEWSSAGFISGTISSQRYQFINVYGEWWFTGYESFGECT